MATESEIRVLAAGCPGLYYALSGFVNAFCGDGTAHDGTNQYSIAQLRREAILALNDANADPCDCELPGIYNSGVPGIVGSPEGIEHAERCDMCERFVTDEEAQEHLKQLGLLEDKGSPS